MRLPQTPALPSSSTSCWSSSESKRSRPSRKIGPVLGMNYALILVLKGLSWTEKTCIPGLKSFPRPARPNSVSPQRPGLGRDGPVGPLDALDLLGLKGLKDGKQVLFQVS